MTPGPLRILQVISSSRDSGAERNVLQLSRSLKNRGHSVAVVCPPDGWLPERCKADGIPVVGSNLRGFGGIRDLLRAVSGGCDLLHAHLTRAAYVSAVAGLLKRIPVVATVHVFSRDLIYRLLSRRGRLIAVSGSAKAALLAIGICPASVDLVYNGTDFLDDPQTPAEEVRREIGLADGPIVGLVGRVCREKGHHIALDAAHALATTHPDCQFLFVGRMEPRFERECSEILSRNGLSRMVKALGPRHDVARLMDAMDVVILPSEKETFGMAAIEAMARGKPVVATRIGGLEEILSDGDTGFLIGQNEQELTEAIRRLLDDPDLARKMGEAGREAVRERFKSARMAEAVEAVYDRVLSPAGRKAVLLP